MKTKTTEIINLKCAKFELGTNDYYVNLSAIDKTSPRRLHAQFKEVIEYCINNVGYTQHEYYDINEDNPYNFYNRLEFVELEITRPQDNMAKRNIIGLAVHNNEDGTQELTRLNRY